MSILGNVCAVLVGLSMSFSVRLVGDLPVAEIVVAAGIIPAIIIYRRRALRPDVVPIYLLMGAWLGSQILTDTYRHTATIDWLRGDAAICFFAIDLAFVVILTSGNELRKILLIAASAVGSLLAYKLQPTDMAIDYPWKFGISGGTNVLVVLVSCYFFNRRRYIPALLLIAGVSAVNLLENFRSPVLLLLITIALAVPVIPEQVGAWRVLPPRGTRMRLLVLVSMALVGGLAASSLVQVLSSRGYLGDEAQAKNESQSHVKGGLLLGGRPEILVSSRAVFDSPVLGHGSWAKDFHYIEMLNDIMIENGTDTNPDVDAIEEDSEGTIPTHSHIMGAWVWAGALGAVFWLYILWIIARASIQLALRQPMFSPLHMFLLSGMIWDIFFSPFGSSRRMMESVILVIALDFLKERPHAVLAVHRFNSRTWRRRQFQRPASAVLRSE